MKVKYLLIVSTMILLFSNCKDSDIDPTELTLSESSFNNISSNGEAFDINISCSSAWTVSNPAGWCTVTPEKGTGDQKIKLSVGANLETSSRTTNITVSSGRVSKTILVSQEGATSTIDNYHYELPVIFHVLYQDEKNSLQYVSHTRLAEILSIVNQMYKKEDKSVNMNLTFTLADTDPDGASLDNPGVEYVQWTESYPIDCEKFMNDNSGSYVKYLWDPNRYINVMIYNFSADESSGTTTLGISHLPFTTTGNNSMEGLNETGHSSLSLKNLKFPYCASINSLYINDQSFGNNYKTTDVTVTVAHELGHYLGLHHVFTELDDDDTNSCEDTDYCEDTPSYNKQAYDEKYIYISKYDPKNFTFANLVKRTNCSGSEFISYNIMDYAVSNSNQFTNDQRNRIRHILTYSPLIPGPKKGQNRTKAASDEPLDLPIRVIK